MHFKKWSGFLAHPVECLAFLLLLAVKIARTPDYSVMLLTAVGLLYIVIYTVLQKAGPPTNRVNFIKSQPIFRILSPQKRLLNFIFTIWISMRPA